MGKLIPYMHSTYPFAIAGMHTSMCPTTTARIASLGLNLLVIDDEASWYIEMLNASAIQNPSKEGVHYLSSDSKGTRSRSLFEGSPPARFKQEPAALKNNCYHDIEYDSDT